MTRLLDLTLEFLEEEPDGLRLIHQPMWSIQCLLVARARIGDALGNKVSRKQLDVPGVYLLFGAEAVTAEAPNRENRLYVGQGDSVADRLESHLKDEQKKWWRTGIVLRRSPSIPLNLSQCKYLESKLCRLAKDAGRCVLDNKNAPQLPALSKGEEKSVDEFLDKALVIISALGWNSFRPQPPIPPVPEPPPPPSRWELVLEAVRTSLVNPKYPRAVWYATRTPDYRAKVVHGDDFRVYARVILRKDYLDLHLIHVGEKGHAGYKLRRVNDLDDELLREISEVYRKAERYLNAK